MNLLSSLNRFNYKPHSVRSFPLVGQVSGPPTPDTNRINSSPFLRSHRPCLTSFFFHHHLLQSICHSLFPKNPVDLKSKKGLSRLLGALSRLYSYSTRLSPKLTYQVSFSPPSLGHSSDTVISAFHHVAEPGPSIVTFVSLHCCETYTLSHPSSLVTGSTRS